MTSTSTAGVSLDALFGISPAEFVQRHWAVAIATPGLRRGSNLPTSDVTGRGRQLLSGRIPLSVRELAMTRESRL